MKYIKTYESTTNFTPLIPGNMYHDKNSNIDVCFIGHNSKHEFPCLCLLLRDYNAPEFRFIEWVEWMETNLSKIPLNMNLKEYIIKNEVVWKTIKSFDNPHFASGGCYQSKKKIKELKEMLLKDQELMELMNKEIEEFEMKKDAKKYNL